MILLIIYCILICVAALLFIANIIAALYDDYKMKNQPLIKRDKKENKRKMVYKVLEELKIR